MKMPIVRRRDAACPNFCAFTYLFTLGGLTVDEDCGAVTRASGGAVPGLYAAGRALTLRSELRDDMPSHPGHKPGRAAIMLLEGAT